MTPCVFGRLHTNIPASHILEEFVQIVFELRGAYVLLHAYRLDPSDISLQNLFTLIQRFLNQIRIESGMRWGERRAFRLVFLITLARE